MKIEQWHGQISGEILKEMFKGKEYVHKRDWHNNLVTHYLLDVRFKPIKFEGYTKEELASIWSEITKNKFSPIVYTPHNFKKNNKILTVLIADAHLGALAFPRTKKNNDEILQEVINKIIEKEQHNNYEEVVIDFMGDYFHFDNADGTTTKHTPLTTDGRTYKQLMIDGVSLARWMIDEFSKLAPVDIHLVHGNHDFNATVHLNHSLYYIYENNKNINVNLNVEYNALYKKGNVLTFLEHGDMPKKNRKVWMEADGRPYASFVKNKIAFFGHDHKMAMYRENGIDCWHVPTICNKDEWTNKMGYRGPMRMIHTSLDTKTLDMSFNITGANYD